MRNQVLFCDGYYWVPNNNAVLFVRASWQTEKKLPPNWTPPPPPPLKIYNPKLDKGVTSHSWKCEPNLPRNRSLKIEVFTHFCINFSFLLNQVPINIPLSSLFRRLFSFFFSFLPDKVMRQSARRKRKRRQTAWPAKAPTSWKRRKRKRSSPHRSTVHRPHRHKPWVRAEKKPITKAVPPSVHQDTTEINAKMNALMVCHPTREPRGGHV